MTGGKAEPDFDNGQHHPNNNYWLLFDVHQDAVLESVDVYSLEGGGQSIEILDGSGAVISTTVQLLDPGLNVFLLNVELPAGTGYGIPLRQRPAPPVAGGQQCRRQLPV